MANGEKTEKLVKFALKLAIETISESQLRCVSTPSSESSCTNAQANKTLLFHVDDEPADTPTNQPQAKKPRLADMEIEKIIMEVRLSDIHINMAQKLLKDQFCSLNGLESILLQAKGVSHTEEMIKNKLQIIYCCEREHWIVATNIKSQRRNYSH